MHESKFCFVKYTGMLAQIFIKILSDVSNTDFENFIDRETLFKISVVIKCWRKNSKLIISWSILDHSDSSNDNRICNFWKIDVDEFTI